MFRFPRKLVSPPGTSGAPERTPLTRPVAPHHYARAQRKQPTPDPSAWALILKLRSWVAQSTARITRGRGDRVPSRRECASETIRRSRIREAVAAGRSVLTDLFPRGRSVAPTHARKAIPRTIAREYSPPPEYRRECRPSPHHRVRVR